MKKGSDNMAKLQNYNGRFCESDYEYAFISFLEQEDWTYLPGDQMKRVYGRDVLNTEDLEAFIKKTNPDLNADEIKQISDTVRLVGAETDFATLHKVYGWMVDGIQFTPQNGQAHMIALIDYEEPKNNMFKVVNQLTVDYTDNGQLHNRRPDVLLYINGIPVCVIELKNPTDEKATIAEAWKQINIRYWRDIPHLLHYCPLACISDGVQTRLGTVRTPYEHFYAWRRVNDEDHISTLPFEETETMIKGVYSPERFLEIFRDYIYFQDHIYDKDEREIVCRYPQFFAARLLKQSIIESVQSKSGKGGTYFGATGCGKTYTMAFLARQLSLRCNDIPEMGSPTIVLIVDREDLQKQGAKLFTKAESFICARFKSFVIARMIQSALSMAGQISSVFLMKPTEHSFHTQKRYSSAKKQTRIWYAKVLREAFPNATFVGFTGTPIAETYQTFGDEIDRYTMDQAVSDGLTVSIKYHPRIAKVLLDKEKVKLIEEYYRLCADEGASEEDIEASKKAMSSLEIILGEKSHLERLAVDTHDHYTSACAADPDRIQKAMIVCSKREIAYDLLMVFKDKYPEWFVERKTPEGMRVTPEEMKELREVPFISMVASVGTNDPKEMYDYLGGTKNDKRSEELDGAFKAEKSNLCIVIVVDMWITGFDVPCLTYMYNDKPLQKHQLIQTISRVNRRYTGKDFGLIIDYIGIRDNMRQALKVYGGNTSVAPTVDDIEQATSIFHEHLAVLRDLFKNYDLAPFMNPEANPFERYRLLAKAAEYVFRSTQELNIEGKRQTNKVSFKTYFLKTVKRMRNAYDICQPSGNLTEEESALAQCFMAIAGFVRKMSGTSEVDTETMNHKVAQMVEEALRYNKVESILEEGEEEDIFSPEYFEKLSDAKMPASKLELLIKMLRKQITEYMKTNQVAAKKYQELLEETIRIYHERRKHLTAEEAGATQEDASDEIIRNATEQALRILKEMQADRDSFRKMGLTFEEKAFYDILMALRDKYNFEYGEDKVISGVVVNEKCKSLAKKIKEIIDVKSSFADWLNNDLVKDQLKYDIKVCLIKNKYPSQYSPEVFSKVMEQVKITKRIIKANITTIIDGKYIWSLPHLSGLQHVSKNMAMIKDNDI